MEHKDDKKYEGVLLGIENPLLDISAEVPMELLEKYGLKMNNAILAEEKHLSLYDEMIKNYKVDYIAGGATQNSIRVAQWMLQRPKATTFIGCVGKDGYAAELRKAADKDGVQVLYLEDDKHPTGTCACLINKHERSLVANLAAANHYKIEHLLSEPITKVWQHAQYFYISGYFLTVSPPSIMHIAKHAAEKNKFFAMNLSAPFISEFFSEPLLAALPYTDLLFGNETEAQTFAKKMDLKDSSIPAVALHIYNMDKVNKKRNRIVAITQGSNDTVLVVDGKTIKVPVPKVAEKDIVDLNGAGDAFVGGFLAALIEGRDPEACAKAGHYAANVIIRVSGTVLSGKPDYKL